MENQEETDRECMNESSADTSGIFSGVSGSCMEVRDMLLSSGSSSGNPQL